MIEIDESAFGKKKYGKGKPNEITWVFGAVERDGLARATIVEDRGAKTLIPLVKEYVEYGSTIISDEWASYNQLKSHGFDHRTICHKKFYARYEFKLN